MARTEYQRRAHYIEKLRGMLVGTSEAVVRLIQQCLENDPRQRPSTQQILQQLKEKWVVPNDPYVELTKLELVVSMRTMQVMYGCNVQVSMPKLGHHLCMCGYLTFCLWLLPRAHKGMSVGGVRACIHNINQYTGWINEAYYI